MFSLAWHWNCSLNNNKTVVQVHTGPFCLENTPKGERNMCKENPCSKPCLNYKCLHNLFWEGLELNMKKTQMTAKALRIGNCCCLVREPWTSEEIAEVWGLTKRMVERWEEAAWKKIRRVLADVSGKHYASLSIEVRFLSGRYS